MYKCFQHVNKNFSNTCTNDSKNFNQLQKSDQFFVYKNAKKKVNPNVKANANSSNSFAHRNVRILL